jgi:hypothetical protein
MPAPGIAVTKTSNEGLLSLFLRCHKPVSPSLGVILSIYNLMSFSDFHVYIRRLGDKKVVHAMLGVWPGARVYLPDTAIMPRTTKAWDKRKSLTAIFFRSLEP